MHSSSFERTVNLDEAGGDEAKAHASALMAKFVESAHAHFDADTAVSLTVEDTPDDSCSFTVKGRNFIAEFSAEISRNIRFLGGKQEKFMSFSISANAESGSLDKTEKTGSNLSLVFSVIGFIVGAGLVIVALKIMAYFTGFYIVHWGLYIAIAIGGGTVFGGIGKWIADRLFYRELESLDSDEDFQDKLDAWNAYVQLVKELLDGVYGEHDPNKYKEQANANSNQAE